jgi:SAM-dependent methyltransferase
MATRGDLWFADRLECPDCVAAPLVAGADGFRCASCDRGFPMRDGQLSCIVSPARRASFEFRLSQTPAVWPPWTPPPDGDYRGPLSPRTSPRQLSILARRAGRLDVLDWGCGTGEYRPLVRDTLGHRYLGVDREGTGADVLADVHRLPFRTASFDHAVTGAVLEHVANPFVAVRELARVLRPGAELSGSAAFLEPQHAGSHFHPTADGLVHVLESAGLEVVGLWPQEGWLVFDSLASMHGPVSAPTRWVLRRLGRLERLLRRAWLHPRERRAGRWLTRKSAEDVRAELLALAGQIDFLARKP